MIQYLRFTPTGTGKVVVDFRTTTQNGCTIDARDSFVVHDIPVSDFAVSDVCLGEDLEPMHASTSPAPTTLVSFTWNMDGSQVSTTEFPTIYGPAVGVRNIELIVESNIGCKDTIEKNVNVFELPAVDFSATDLCFGKTTTLADNSTVGIGSIATRTWNVNSTQLTGNPVTVDFPAVATYPVQLIATSSNGCIDSLTKKH